MRTERVVYRRTRYWPAGVEYYASARIAKWGGTFFTTGMGRTPAKARLDLLFQQGRRRNPPHDR
jgi:hypothetical protein